MRNFCIWWLLERLPTAERVFVEFHVDAFASKLHAFHGEAEALFGCSFSAELDLAADSDDALPREALEGSVAEQAGHGTVVERIACGGRHLAVGGDLAFGDGADDAAEGVVALLVFAEAFFEDATLEVLRDGRGAHGENLSGRCRVVVRCYNEGAQMMSGLIKKVGDL